jgi:pilus assembly protein Flp/PilA
MAQPAGGGCGTPVAMGLAHVAASAAVSSTICGAAARSHRMKRCNASGEDSMSMLINYVKSFARNEEGQDLLEYALLVALIALVAITAVGLAGTAVSNIFTDIAGQLSNPA